MNSTDDSFHRGERAIHERLGLGERMAVAGRRAIRDFMKVLRSAGDLAEIYSLRGFDSIHLASALWLKARVSVPVDFAVFDRRLGVAASRAGLSVVPKSRP